MDATYSRTPALNTEYSNNCRFYDFNAFPYSQSLLSDRTKHSARNMQGIAAMANQEEEEEAAPLLKPEAQDSDSVSLAGTKPRDPSPPLAPAVCPVPAAAVDCGVKGTAQWAADGVPVAAIPGSAVGEPLLRDQWDSGLFSCLGHNDEFCSSDLEVCKFVCFFPLGFRTFSRIWGIGKFSASKISRIWFLIEEIMYFMICSLGLEHFFLVNEPMNL